MSWSRAMTPNAMVAPGDELTVKVLRVDEATQKISLGLKQLLDDPWSTVAAKYAIGQVVAGHITRVADFGAFVELEPGVEALAHASTFAPTGRRDGWTTLVRPGLTATFEILSIDSGQKRIGVALVEEGSARAAAALREVLTPGAIVTGKVERHEKFGVLVFLSPGRTGMLPVSETGLDRDADLVKAFPKGSDVELVVLETDSAGRRIRLSRKALAEQKERAELHEYVARADAAPTASLGSLADSLRNALKGR
jgi:small subunit ribosomal protein S1